MAADEAGPETALAAHARVDFQGRVARGEKLAPAALQVLAEVVKNSEAGTVMGLEREVRDALAAIRASVGRKSISLEAASELFFRFVTRVALDSLPFEVSKQQMIVRFSEFAQSTEVCAERVAQSAERFVADGCTVLVHGNSSLVTAILERARSSGKSFRVIATEGRPFGDGLKMVKRLHALGIPVTMVVDAAVGAIMEQVSMVLVGAEGIVENGGLVNRIGTLTIALAAKAFNRPFYVASECFKFARLYPLNQKDLLRVPGMELGPRFPAVGTRGPPEENASSSDSDSFDLEVIPSDFTPSQYITLLFTDEGVLTPAAVSDKLIATYMYMAMEN
ncbi:Translation initiation factor eIF-2B subunit alpha [Porphyridium purpureum]|uniref:Translation initiation factor eIF2B subunit alpha n=1 Tax=Porphyridium purpureum TaxID=35688 RepID=A0A5J4YUT5_PORPP|nr:Translation initiation factor eIF-2B subunit alpha [Porphyridium purpureum]|eukprot:POR0655..scf227_4